MKTKKYNIFFAALLSAAVMVSAGCGNNNTAPAESSTTTTISAADDIAQYMDMTYYSRNTVMAEKAAEFIRNGNNVFFMVGVSHFAGDKGIPALLTDMGYTVEKLY